MTSYSEFHPRPNKSQINRILSVQQLLKSFVNGWDVNMESWNAAITVEEPIYYSTEWEDKNRPESWSKEDSVPPPTIWCLYLISKINGSKLNNKSSTKLNCNDVVLPLYPCFFFEQTDRHSCTTSSSVGLPVGVVVSVPHCLVGMTIVREILSWFPAKH